VSFARPLLLLALGLVPLWWWLRAKRLARLSGTRMSDVRAAAGVTERLWVARLPVTLRSACLGAWIIAAAGPRVGAARSETRSEGISIVLAVDISGSMQAEDFAPANRIDIAKQTAIEFVRARTSDRIGLVAFAGQALTQVPLTTDYAVLEQALRGLHPGMLEDGTAIGTAIATAANRLRRVPGRSKVLVLLTDGVNNKGTVDPRTAGQAAAAFGIKIHVIGVGTRGQAPVPTEYGPDGKLRYEMRPVEIDEALMTEIASLTGGRYYRATDTESLRHVFEEINRLEKTTVEQVVYRRFDEAYRVPLALGLVALALEIVLAGTFAVRVP
jgi:Ca-activated chloride channel homolog